MGSHGEQPAPLLAHSTSVVACTDESMAQQVVPPLPPKLRPKPQRKSNIGPSKQYADEAAFEADLSMWKREQAERALLVQERERVLKRQRDQRRDRSNRQRTAADAPPLDPERDADAKLIRAARDELRKARGRPLPRIEQDTYSNLYKLTQCYHETYDRHGPYMARECADALRDMWEEILGRPCPAICEFANEDKFIGRCRTDDRCCMGSPRKSGEWLLDSGHHVAIHAIKPGTMVEVHEGTFENGSLIRGAVYHFDFNPPDDEFGPMLPGLQTVEVGLYDHSFPWTLPHMDPRLDRWHPRSWAQPRCCTIFECEPYGRMDEDSQQTILQDDWPFYYRLIVSRPMIHDRWPGVNKPCGGTTDQDKWLLDTAVGRP